MPQPKDELNTSNPHRKEVSEKTKIIKNKIKAAHLVGGVIKDELFNVLTLKQRVHLNGIRLRTFMRIWGLRKELKEARDNG